ncbi:unnamed protein product [Phytophthora fragariaefolia]|uniref:Unnamed protein product n=1 Tax=Phytophthora fragariaefolia TaxID=1490495 RepID=A0A9W7CY26_9STRA|nr:unnamed protein product [Phytophthora fragariaefolia]
MFWLCTSSEADPLSEPRSVWNRLSRELGGPAEGRLRSKLTLVPSESSSAPGPARDNMELQDVNVDDASDRGPAQKRMSADVDELTERAAAMQLESDPSPMPRSPDLQLQIPNPFEPSDQPDTDELLQTVSPASSGQRVAAAPALPQPPRFESRTMQDRRNFMRRYETHLTVFRLSGAAPSRCRLVPVLSPHLITEEQWIGYFMKANTPSHVDYASVDEAMKKLQMRTAWLDPVSRMMNLQADSEAVLDQFNLAEVVFDHEQRRIVKYLANALAPASFKAAIATKLTLHENKRCQPGKAAQLLKARRERHDAARNATMRRFDVVEPGKPAQQRSCMDKGTTDAEVDGVSVKVLLLDSGADTSLVARGVLDAIRVAGREVSVSDVDVVRLNPVGGRTIDVHREVIFREVVLTPSARPLMLRNLKCYGEEANDAMDETVGRPIMEILGYSTDKLLVEARDASPEWELGLTASANPSEDSADTAQQRMCRLQVGTRDPPMPEDEADGIERHEIRTALPRMHPTDLKEVVKYLERKIEIAERMGLTLDGRAKLRAVMRVRVDNFRLEFGNDPPVRVAPMQVRLKNEARPVRAQPRRYSPNDRAFLDRHTAALLAHGLVYKNHPSRWASAPRIIRKREQDVDPTADPRMTIDTRSVNERTEPRSWPMPVLDVVLGELEGARVFFVLDWFRGYWQLPLHPDSQELYSFVTHRGIYTPTRAPMGATDSVAYCQGVVDEIFGDLIGDGILAWLDDILGYAENESALLELLDKVLSRCEAFENIRGALLRMVPLAHPIPTAEVALYTDASQEFWGAMVSQLEPLEVSRPLDDQHHQPLAFLSGRFVGVAARWPTIEKEAFAIVKATRRLEYLLLRPKGFRLYMDHRNLVYIFDPYATDGAMARYQADKLQRWVM